MFSTATFGTLFRCQLPCSFVRKTSTLVGRSGRTYTRAMILQKHPEKSALDIWFAYTPDDQLFVLKPVSPQIFDFAQEMRREFGHERRLRNHVDENKAEHTLIYEHYLGNLLSVIKYNADIPLKPRKFILHEIGLAVKALHSKNYVHLDIKPNNIFLSWKPDSLGQFEATHVVLGDLDTAYQFENDELLDLKMGNVLWRSPEGQAAKGVGKASEIFSFGLTCFFTITGAEFLHSDFKKLDDLVPEHVTVYKLLQAFGPAPPGLFAHVQGDELWTDLLTECSELVEEQTPGGLFQSWNENIIPNLDVDTKRFLSRMLNLDPKERATIDQIMEDSWWDRK